MDILVPLKGLETGKSRLRECLNAYQRRNLCERLLVSTIRVAVNLVGSDRVHLVTSDPEAKSITQHFGVQLIVDSAIGLNEALEQARSTLASKGRSNILILPIDLPYVDLEALKSVTACLEDVAIASDERGTGTNILLLRSQAAQLPLCYGDRSFPAHIAEARALGLSVCVVTDQRLLFDLDEPSHYYKWLKDADHAVTQTSDRG